MTPTGRCLVEGCTCRDPRPLRLREARFHRARFAGAAQRIVLRDRAIQRAVTVTGPPMG